MKKWLVPLIIAISVLVVFALITCGIYFAFFDIQRIEGQKIISTSDSPNATYTITAYLNNGGATTDYSVLCSVKNNETGKTKNIYWNYHCYSADIQWLDENTVIINNVELDVNKDTYDFRKN